MLLVDILKAAIITIKLTAIIKSIACPCQKSICKVTRFLIIQWLIPNKFIRLISSNKRFLREWTLSWMKGAWPKWNIIWSIFSGKFGLVISAAECLFSFYCLQLLNIIIKVVIQIFFYSALPSYFFSFLSKLPFGT